MSKKLEINLKKSFSGGGVRKNIQTPTPRKKISFNHCNIFLLIFSCLVSYSNRVGGTLLVAKTIIYQNAKLCFFLIKIRRLQEDENFRTSLSLSLSLSPSLSLSHSHISLIHTSSLSQYIFFSVSLSHTNTHTHTHTKSLSCL